MAVPDRKAKNSCPTPSQVGASTYDFQATRSGLAGPASGGSSTLEFSRVAPGQPEGY